MNDSRNPARLMLLRKIPSFVFHCSCQTVAMSSSDDAKPPAKTAAASNDDKVENRSDNDQGEQISEKPAAINDFLTRLSEAAHAASATNQPTSVEQAAIRQRNALYSRRLYHKRKIELEVLQERSKRLQTEQEALMMQNQTLTDAVNRAEEMARRVEAGEHIPEESAEAIGKVIVRGTLDRSTLALIL